jgi:hypothetical protein
MSSREWAQLGSIDAPYWSDKTRELVKNRIPERRAIFVKEYAHALAYEREYELKAGSRFRDDDRILSRLERANAEKDALLNTDLLIDKMLESMAYGDYWYTYEKDWG